MSETKFTPGPWEYESHGQMIMTDNGQKMIADIRGWGWIQYLPEGEKIQDANGYLIAAAPDMYEELECARDVFRFYQSQHEFKGGTEKAIRNKEIADRIDRLLAKVRGQE